MGPLEHPERPRFENHCSNPTTPGRVGFKGRLYSQQQQQMFLKHWLI